MFESLKELSDIIEEGKRRIQKEGKAAVKTAFQELFEKYPNLQAVAWNQYTPYFNDGEPCEFGVNDWSAKLVEAPEGHEDEEDDWGREGYLSEYTLRDGNSKMVADIDRLFQLAGEESMLACFGDHVEVVATSKGFDVEEYNHD